LLFLYNFTNTGPVGFCALNSKVDKEKLRSTLADETHFPFTKCTGHEGEFRRQKKKSSIVGSVERALEILKFLWSSFSTLSSTQLSTSTG